MPVALELDHDRRLRLWRLDGLLRLDEFRRAYNAERDAFRRTAGYRVLAILAEDTELHELDRNALARLREEDILAWGDADPGERVRAAFLCPTVLHDAIVRLYAMEMERNPGPDADIRAVSTADEAAEWLDCDLADLPLPAYARRDERSGER